MSLAALPGSVPSLVTGVPKQEWGAVLRALQVKLLSFPFPQCPLLPALKNPTRSCWGEQEKEKPRKSHRGEMISGFLEGGREISAIRECLELGGIHEDCLSSLCHCCSLRKGLKEQGVRRGQELE